MVGGDRKSRGRKQLEDGRRQEPGDQDSVLWAMWSFY